MAKGGDGQRGAAMIRRTIVLAFACLGLSIWNGGCTPIAVEAARKALENRTTEDQLTDGKIAAGIVQRLADRDQGRVLDFSVDVWEQRVLLTGTLDGSTPSADIVRLVRETTGLKGVRDYVEIKPRRA